MMIGLGPNRVTISQGAAAIGGVVRGFVAQVSERVLTIASQARAVEEVVTRNPLWTKRHPSPVLAFTPHFHPDFPPLAVNLKRQGRDCPVVIEHVSVEEAIRLARGEVREELINYSTVVRDGTPFILLVRTLDGTVEGVAISTLLHNRNRVTMRCDRDRKLDLNPETAIRDMGVAMVIARFLYMKRKGYWYRAGAILDGYDPGVSNSYRRKCGIPVFATLTCSLDSFTRGEGEQFLNVSAKCRDVLGTKA